MPVFEIVKGKRWHCGVIARRLRAEQAEASVRFGAQVHRRLVEVFDQSSFCRAWLIDGRIAGLGGVSGPLASSTGEIWLALTEEACRYPVATVRQALATLHEIMQLKKKIVTTIFESDVASKRFALKLGFEICGDAFEQNGQRLITVSLGEMHWPSQPYQPSYQH